MVGFEPTRDTPTDFKSVACANFATPTYMVDPSGIEPEPPVLQTGALPTELKVRGIGSRT